MSCGSFIDVWGPYLWLAVALLAIIFLARVLTKRKAAMPPTTAPAQSEQAAIGPTPPTDPHYRRLFIFGVVCFCVILALFVGSRL